MRRGIRSRRCVVSVSFRLPSKLQTGASLIVSLLMLIAVLLLGISAAQLALQGEKASRNDRDRQIAFQAAEAALMDAERDIENSADAARSRSQIFSKDSTMGFPGEGEPGCRAGTGNKYLGLCKRAPDNAIPTWQTVDFMDDSAGASSVPFGTFTGEVFPVAKGSLPARLSRYVIELMIYNKDGESADQVSYFYRITAIGFGAHESTQVLLQTFYRKEN